MAGKVEVGQRIASQVQILSGLAAGDRVVLHPSDRIRETVCAPVNATVDD